MPNCCGNTLSGPMKRHSAKLSPATRAWTASALRQVRSPDSWRDFRVYRTLRLTSHNPRHPQRNLRLLWINYFLIHGNATACFFWGKHGLRALVVLELPRLPLRTWRKFLWNNPRRRQQQRGDDLQAHVRRYAHVFVLLQHHQWLAPASRARARKGRKLLWHDRSGRPERSWHDLPVLD